MGEDGENAAGRPLAARRTQGGAVARAGERAREEERVWGTVLARASGKGGIGIFSFRRKPPYFPSFKARSLYSESRLLHIEYTKTQRAIT